MIVGKGDAGRHVSQRCMRQCSVRMITRWTCILFDSICSILVLMCAISETEGLFFDIGLASIRGSMAILVRIFTILFFCVGSVKVLCIILARQIQSLFIDSNSVTSLCLCSASLQAKHCSHFGGGYSRRVRGCADASTSFQAVAMTLMGFKAAGCRGLEYIAPHTFPPSDPRYRYVFSPSVPTLLLFHAR